LKDGPRAQALFDGISTIAGHGRSGDLDDPVTFGRFSAPWGIAMDCSNHQLFITDRDTHEVRRISQQGAVTTIAGCGQKGYLDGSRLSSFHSPFDLVVDSHHNLLVVDFENHCIRKIHANGTVSTLAGTGERGYVDGPHNQALFNFPNGIAIDNYDNAYVADTGNARIRVVSPAGVVTTLAGDGSIRRVDGVGLKAAFNGPRRLAFDQRCTMLFVTQDDGFIRTIKLMDDMKLFNSITIIAQEEIKDLPSKNSKSESKSLTKPNKPSPKPSPQSSPSIRSRRLEGSVDRTSL